MDELGIIIGSYYFEKEYYGNFNKRKYRIVFRIKDIEYPIYEDIEHLKNLSKSIINDIFERAKEELEKEWISLRNFSCNGDKPLLDKINVWEKWKSKALRNFKKSEIEYRTYVNRKRYGGPESTKLGDYRSSKFKGMDAES